MPHQQVSLGGSCLYVLCTPWLLLSCALRWVYLPFLGSPPLSLLNSIISVPCKVQRPKVLTDFPIKYKVIFLLWKSRGSGHFVVLKWRSGSAPVMNLILKRKSPALLLLLFRPPYWHHGLIYPSGVTLILRNSFGANVAVIVALARSPYFSASNYFTI